jgi:alpha-beta hydrolase superfamily lysophospholipase
VNATQFQLELASGLSLHIHRWLPDGPVRAVLQITHGMAEHGARYARLAQALTDAGFAVYAIDLPGHGQTARDAGELGHFADDDGWRLALNAIAALRAQLEHEQAGKPLFMLGHSMGSFLMQTHVVEQGAGLAGVILSATSGDLGPLRVVGLNLLRIEKLLMGGRHRSALAEALSFKTFNKAFAPNRTESDWLSRDVAEVDKYLADPRCGFRCSVGLWISLLNHGGQLRDPARLARIPRNLPILMIAGEQDPVTRGAKGPRALEQAYRASGIRNVSVNMYAGARHELLNETCRDQVTTDLRDWLVNHLPNAES